VRILESLSGFGICGGGNHHRNGSNLVAPHYRLHTQSTPLSDFHHMKIPHTLTFSHASPSQAKAIPTWHSTCSESKEMYSSAISLVLTLLALRKLTNLRGIEIRILKNVVSKSRASSKKTCKVRLPSLIKLLFWQDVKSPLGIYKFH
jgi:hypothetical protein